MKDWNNKLALDFFTTIRFGTVEKIKYYTESKGEEFSVILNGNEVQQANLISVSACKINELHHQLCYLDAGLSYDEFYKLMEKFYSQKPEWDRQNSLIVILLFRTTTRIKYS